MLSSRMAELRRKETYFFQKRPTKRFLWYQIDILLQRGAHALITNGWVTWKRDILLWKETHKETRVIRKETYFSEERSTRSHHRLLRYVKKRQTSRKRDPQRDSCDTKRDVYYSKEDHMLSSGMGEIRQKQTYITQKRPRRRLLLFCIWKETYITEKKSICSHHEWLSYVKKRHISLKETHKETRVIYKKRHISLKETHMLSSRMAELRQKRLICKKKKNEIKKEKEARS